MSFPVSVSGMGRKYIIVRPLLNTNVMTGNNAQTNKNKKLVVSQNKRHRKKTETIILNHFKKQQQCKPNFIKALKAA
jgi:hypothetical protein